MNRTLLTLAAAAAVLTGCRSERPVAGDDITVACYYFPNYHTGDPLNELNKGEGWSEWKLVREAQPRFEGHDQPKVPLWGYTDEKDPAVMARKIEAAASHGIDVMLFDWYRYDSVPFLNRCLDEGFLKAPNVNDIRFGLMWANHDWVEIHPATHGEPQKLLYPGKVSPEAFETIGDELVRDYFTQPNYWLIDGKAYFSVYDVQKFVESFGSLEATKAAMDRLREKAVAAGLKGVHWNLVVWGNPILPVEKVPANTLELLRALGFDSATSYVWIHHCWPADTCTAYNSVRDASHEPAERLEPGLRLPLFGHSVRQHAGELPGRAADDQRPPAGRPRRSAYFEHQLLERMDRGKLSGARLDTRHEVSGGRPGRIRRHGTLILPGQNG